jgi:hypothetical protein
MSHLRIFNSTYVPVGLSHLEPQIRQGESRREEERQRYNQEQQQIYNQRYQEIERRCEEEDNRTKVLDIAKTKKVAIKKPAVKKPRTKRILVPDSASGLRTPPLRYDTSIGSTGDAANLQSIMDFKKDIISSLKQQSNPPISSATPASNPAIIEQKEKPKIDYAARMQKAREAKERNKIKREEEMRQKIKKELETENMLLDNKEHASKSS